MIFIRRILFVFVSGHIPHARYFDQLECTTPTEFLPRGLPEPKAFGEYLTRLGVSNTDHVVLYDRSAAGFFAAGRAWVILKVKRIQIYCLNPNVCAFQAYGVENLSILNGGYNAWTKEINEIETTEPSPAAAVS